MDFITVGSPLPNPKIKGCHLSLNDQVFKFAVLNTNRLLLIVLMWFLGQWVMTTYFMDSQKFSLTIAPLNTQQASEPPKSIVLKGALFGEPSQQTNQAEISPPVVSEQELQKTRLNLILKGTIVTPSKNIALIQNGNQTLVLAVGDVISANVKLQEIHDTFIVINNKGTFEKLNLPGVDVSSRKSAPTAASSSGLGVEQKQKLDEVRKQIKQSPLTISRYIRVRTLQSGGKVTGLQLWPRTEKAIFEALGFKSGDRLTAVNGQLIAELADDQAKWMGMMNQNQVSFTVERNGVLQTIDVNLE